MADHGQETSIRAVNRQRLEFLFDGVFAIAMTILVLELKVPELVDRRSPAELLGQLAHHGRAFFSYALSFLVLGVFWYLHHVIFRCLRRITCLSYALHVVLMATAAFFPFCAALLGRYPANPATFPIYFGCILVYQGTSGLLLWVGGRQHALDPDIDPAELKQLRAKCVRSLVGMTFFFTFYSVLRFVISF